METAARVVMAFVVIAVGLVLTPERAAAVDSMLTVVVEGPGSVESVPSGILCPPTCSGFFSGAVTLTADPADGSVISGWAGCPVIQVVDIPDTCVVEMDVDRGVTAIFVDPVAFTVLDDVVVGPQGSSFGYRKVLSGDKVYAVYYDPDASEDQTQLFVTNGQPGSGRFIEVNTTGGVCNFPQDVTGCSFLSEFSNNQPFGEDSLIFVATDGHEPTNFGLRLFISDGTFEGTHPLKPPLSSTDCAGYYGLSGGGNHFNPIAALAGAPGGAAFFGVEIGDGDCAPLATTTSPFPKPRVPWFVSTVLGNPVTSLERGFVTTAVAGMAQGNMVALLDDRVFAVLRDCSGASCIQDGEFVGEGSDLYWADLSAAEGATGYAWSLVGGTGLVPGYGGVSPTYMTTTASEMIFQTPGGTGTLLYATDGPVLDPMAEIPRVITPPGTCCVSEGIAVEQDYYFYAPHDSADRYQGFDLNRYAGSTGEVTAVAQCGDDASVDDYGTTPYPPMVALGDTLYFACAVRTTPPPEWPDGSPAEWSDQAVPDYHVAYTGGLWKVDAGSDTAVRVWEPEEKVMPCMREVEDPDGNPFMFPTSLVEGYVDQIVSFGGAIYFLGADTTMFDPDDPATCFSRRGELYVYTGSGDPRPIPFNPEGPSGGGTLLGRRDDLVVWANDGIHGTEPWTGDIVPMADLTLAVSGPGVVSAAAYAGLPLSSIDDCAAACAYPFPSGSRAVLTAVATPGATFVGWSSNCASLAPDAEGNPRCLVRMSSPRTVGAVFAGPGDALAVGASGPAEVGPGGLIPYSVVVGNLTGAPLGDVVLDVTLSAGTLDLALTTWCQASGAGYTCALAPIPGSSAKALRLFATAPLGGSVEATFAVSSSASDTYSPNDSVVVSSVVAPDLLAATLVSYPSRVPSGGVLTYRVDVRDVGDESLTGIELHVGFNHLGMEGQAFAAPCTEDPTADPGYSVTATCDVIDLAPGGRATVEVSVPAPGTLTDIPLAATFWLEYTPSGPRGITANDVAGPVSTLVLAEVAGDQLTQESDAPLDTGQTLGTSSPGGTSISDPTGLDVDLPAGFAGLFTSSEIQAVPPAVLALAGASTTTSPIRILAATGGGPRGVFSCNAGIPTYPAACWAFDTTIEQTSGGAPIPLLLSLTFDASGFVSSSTGRVLLIRRTRLFFQLGGVGSFAPVARCPSSVSATNYATYAGAAPCLLSKRVDGGTGDYLFVVVTPRGGTWKTGI